PQAFSMAVDTGAADIIVMGKQCTSDGCPSFSTLYDPTASSTSKNASSSGQTNTLFFASGSVTGYIFTDVIALDDFSATDAQFLLGTSLSDGISTSTSPLPVSGLLGLAFGGVSGLATTLTPFWKTVADSGQMESPEISLYFARALATATGQQEAPGGTLTFGGTNTSLYSGDIEFLNLTGKAGTYWSLDVVSVSVQGTHFLANTTTHRATFDSGASAIGGPLFDVAKIWAAVPGSNTIPSQSGFYSYPCNTTLNISISFGGRAWPIHPADMNLGTVDSDSSQCVGGIYALSSSEADEIFSSSTTGSDRPSWMLGIVFLKNVYTVLRHIPPSIGLAELSTLAGGKGWQKI
ncbi:aspartic peptidase A1, partial [Mycena amicta]